LVSLVEAPARHLSVLSALELMKQVFLTSLPSLVQFLELAICLLIPLRLTVAKLFDLGLELKKRLISEYYKLGWGALRLYQPLNLRLEFCFASRLSHVC